MPSVTRDAPRIGSERFHRLRQVAYRRILSQVTDLWRPWSAEWEVPTDLRGRKNAPRRCAAISKADDGIAFGIASSLATAIVLDTLDRRYRPRPPRSAKRVRRSRALNNPSLSLTEALRVSWEAHKEQKLYGAALERHHSAYHVERIGTGRGRPSNPGLDHAVDALRIVFDNATTSAALYGLRLRSGFPLWKLTATILRRLRLRPKGRAGELKLARSVQSLRLPRVPRALENLASRLPAS